MLGIREGTWLRRRTDTLELGGISAGARLFRRGSGPAEIATGTDLSELLRISARFDVHQ